MPELKTLKRFGQHKTGNGSSAVPIPLPSVSDLETTVSAKQAYLSHLRKGRGKKRRADLIADTAADLTEANNQLTAAKAAAGIP